MNLMKTIAIQEVVLAPLVSNGPARGSSWIVKVDGKPVANFRTLAGAQRKAARLAA
jgi:hypothetical protein